MTKQLSKLFLMSLFTIPFVFLPPYANASFIHKIAVKDSVQQSEIVLLGTIARLSYDVSKESGSPYTIASIKDAQIFGALGLVR